MYCELSEWERGGQCARCDSFDTDFLKQLACVPIDSRSMFQPTFYTSEWRDEVDFSYRPFYGSSVWLLQFIVESNICFGRSFIYCGEGFCWSIYNIILCIICVDSFYFVVLILCLEDIVFVVFMLSSSRFQSENVLNVKHIKEWSWMTPMKLV